VQVIDVRNSLSAGATSFNDLTLLSNDIPAMTRREDELELRISDDDDDALGRSEAVSSLLSLPLCYH